MENYTFYTVKYKCKLTHHRKSITHKDHSSWSLNSTWLCTKYIQSDNAHGPFLFVQPNESLVERITDWTFNKCKRENWMLWCLNGGKWNVWCYQYLCISEPLWHLNQTKKNKVIFWHESPFVSTFALPISWPVFSFESISFAAFT